MMEELTCCPQCDQPLGLKTRLIREEVCGHLKCRSCLLDEEDGCRQCITMQEEYVVGGPEVVTVMKAEVQEEDPVLEDLKPIPVMQYREEEGGVGGEYLMDLPVQHQEGGEMEEDEYTEEVEFDEIITAGEEEEEEYGMDADGVEVDMKPYRKNSIKKSFPSHVHQIEVQNTETNETERAFRCEICSKTFRSVHQVRYHVYCDPTVEKPNKCNQCDATFRTGYQLKQHLQLHSNSYYECQVCGKKFAHDASAMKHYKKHRQADQLEGNSSSKSMSKRIQPAGEFPCEICKKVFARRDYLKKHQICHTEEKRFQCKLCDKRYMRFNALKFHIQSTHEKCEEFVCSTCNKSFSSLQSLQRHVATHSSQSRIACNICGLRSTRKDNLMRHIRAFHPDSDPKESINFNPDDGESPSPSQDMNETENALDQLKTSEIRSKEAHLRKNVIVTVKESSENNSVQGEEEEEMYMPVESLEETIVVLGMEVGEKKEKKEPIVKEERRKSSKKMQSFDIYRKILNIEGDEADD